MSDGNQQSEHEGQQEGCSLREFPPPQAPVAEAQDCVSSELPGLNQVSFQVQRKDDRLVGYPGPVIAVILFRSDVLGRLPVASSLEARARSKI